MSKPKQNALPIHAELEYRSIAYAAATKFIGCIESSVPELLTRLGISYAGSMVSQCMQQLNTTTLASSETDISLS